MTIKHWRTFVITTLSIGTSAKQKDAAFIYCRSARFIFVYYSSLWYLEIKSQYSYISNVIHGLIGITAIKKYERNDIAPFT